MGATRRAPPPPPLPPPPPAPGAPLGGVTCCRGHTRAPTRAGAGGAGAGAILGDRVRLPVNGTTLHAEMIGEGAPCLCLHGGPGTDCSGLARSLAPIGEMLGLR